MNTSQEINLAISRVRGRFPFKGHMHPSKGLYRSVADTVLKWMKPPATILDFGAGAGEMSAILSALGFKCIACDDFGDDWHKRGENRASILKFAEEFGVNYVDLSEIKSLPFSSGAFDLIMLLDVLEHLHESPRTLMGSLLPALKSGGFLLVSVPNAANVVKRIRVLFGESNFPPFEMYYWYPGQWRGHVREYVRSDLLQLCAFMDLEVLELRGRHHMLHAMPSALRPVWIALTAVFRGGRDSWLLLARKRPGWSPVTISEDSLEDLLRPAGGSKR